MAGSGKPSIPTWQLQQQSSNGAGQEEVPKLSAPADGQVSAVDRQSLLDQASKFLEDESIRDAPTERKIAFLESKGLTNSEIQNLLGVSRNPDASGSAGAESTESSGNENALQEPKKVKPSSQLSQSQTSAAAAQGEPRSRDLPPIITYPEFLYQAQKPPPLVTLRSVLYTIYGASGLAASIYGASEFLVKPMVASLTSARHDLAETTQRNLEKLNIKLEANVSTIPPSALTKTHRSNGKDEDGAESVTSDPTELFHRDIATQTTPDLGATSSSSSSTGTANGPETSNAEKVVNKHLSRLQNISYQLREVQTAESRVDATYNDARDRLAEFHTYLDSLTYSSPTYINQNLYGVYNDDAARDGKKSGMSSGEEDAIAAFKAEVRGMKGTLLSAKNFPSGAPGYRFKGR
ncbi:hypothetical protein VTO42DRAFT_6695 [Malbranchea cinnamomea]